MKILQVSYKYPFPANDGGAIAMVNLAEGMARAGHEISLLAIKTPKHGGKADGREASSVYEDITAVYIDTTIKPFRLLHNLIFSNQPYNAERFIDRDFRQKLTALLKQKPYDVVQLEGLYLMPYADTIRQHSEAKISLRLHNVEHEVWNRIAQQTQHPLFKPYYKILARRMAAFESSYINRYDLLVPVSERDNRFYASLGNTRASRVIPVGMDTSAIPARKIDPGHRSLFFIGSLDYIPNQEGLIWFIENVWKKFFHADGQCPFYIAGRNAPAHLVNYLRKRSVTFVGEVEDAAAFMVSGGIMVVPLLAGGGIRVKIIEAMALGIPVVSTSVGAEGLDVSDGLNILITDDPEGISDAVHKLLENPAFYTKIGKNARIFIEEKMNGAFLAKELLNFYKINL